MDYERYMHRALTLAANGEGSVSPNPMVGAVIVGPDGNIIGEGWHRKYGEAHAEVNACNSVPAELYDLFPESTIFVTLEPCSHYGKTPPCSDLLISKRFKRVIIGSADPFHKVDGHGIKKLRDAGIEVIVGVLEKECRALNKTFFFSHTHARPFVTLKWAQSSDGWMDSKTHHPYRFSNDITQTLIHRLRGLNDAILTSTRTVEADDPRLDSRYWNSCRCPKPVIVGSRMPEKEFRLFRNPDLISYVGTGLELNEILEDLYSTHGFTSVLVEAGPRLLAEFINRNLWQEARVEVGHDLLGDEGIHKAPIGLPAPRSAEDIGNNTFYHYVNFTI